MVDSISAGQTDYCYVQKLLWRECGKGFVMPKGSEELTNARKEEIINACASLYKTMSFRDITIRDIGEKTSFTRTSIYNYFQTREEIFLALLKREHEMWSADLEGIVRTHDTMSVEAFADALAATLEKRSCMLKLMSMNLYDMESNSRMENLVEFKKAYAGALGAVRRCMEKFFPDMSVTDIQEFVYMLFPFLFGVYPYTTATEKQREAMELAHVEQVSYSVREIVRLFVSKLL